MKNNLILTYDTMNKPYVKMIKILINYILNHI
jgi:hypothetical protein